MTGTVSPVVDIIVPVHDDRRAVARAVSSVVQSSTTTTVIVTVVCHNIAEDRIARALGPDLVNRIRLVSLQDGIPSPAGPKNFAFAETSGDFVVFLDSDDTLESGAIDYWVDMAERDELAAVIAAERFATGATIRTPPTRAGRTVNLHPIRDRLTYRTAPLGLLRRSVLEQLDALFTPGLATGEDQALTSRLWFSGRRIGFARRGPAYLVGDDADVRVTGVARSAGDEFRAIDELIRGDWFAAQPGDVRRTIITRIVRVHIFGGALARGSADLWSDPDRVWFSSALVRLGLAAPGYERVLSVADRRFVDALVAGGATADEVVALGRARRRFGSPATIVTRDIRGLLAIDGPLRFMIASALV